MFKLGRRSPKPLRTAETDYADQFSEDLDAFLQDEFVYFLSLDELRNDPAIMPRMEDFRARANEYREMLGAGLQNISWEQRSEILEHFVGIPELLFDCGLHEEAFTCACYLQSRAADNCKTAEALRDLLLNKAAQTDSPWTMAQLCKARSWVDDKNARASLADRIADSFKFYLTKTCEEESGRLSECFKNERLLSDDYVQTVVQTIWNGQDILFPDKVLTPFGLNITRDFLELCNEREDFALHRIPMANFALDVLSARPYDDQSRDALFALCKQLIACKNVEAPESEEALKLTERLTNELVYKLLPNLAASYIDEELDGKTVQAAKAVQAVCAAADLLGVIPGALVGVYWKAGKDSIQGFASSNDPESDRPIRLFKMSANEVVLTEEQFKQRMVDPHQAACVNPVSVFLEKREQAPATPIEAIMNRLAWAKNCCVPG